MDATAQLADLSAQMEQNYKTQMEMTKIQNEYTTKSSILKAKGEATQAIMKNAVMQK